MQQSFIDYAMTTITNRALPDVRDGLKPVHRRLMYGMRNLKLYHNTPHKKSARIVGDVLGRLHPHGDSSVYEAMVRLSQDFSLNVPLVDGHGNFGSIDGDGAAAMRYTEARLSEAGESLSQDLEKGVVNFKENYDGSEKEPVVLPARIPNLLINGSEGIATGMATNIPTHNAQEVAEALQYVLRYEEKAKVEKIVEKLPAPDFPMGGLIVNKDELDSFYFKGYGKVVMRGEYKIEEEKGKKSVVFTSIPTKSVGNKTRLMEELTELVHDGILSEASKVVDESNREGIRIVFSLKKDADVDTFLNKCWLKSKLQDWDRMQFLVLVNGKPQTLNVLEYFLHYIDFQKEIHTKRNEYLLSELEKRKEIVDGLLKAHSVMDALIDAIRSSASTKTLMGCLTKGNTGRITFRLKKHEKVAKKFNFTERQAEAILNRRLRTLSGLDINKLEKEQKELMKEKDRLLGILNDETLLKKELSKDINLLIRTHGEPRKTKLTQAKTIDESVLEEKVAGTYGVVVDNNGYVRKLDTVSGTKTDVILREDISATDTVCLFTTKGNLYQVRVDDIPEKNTPIQALSSMEPGEKLLYVTTNNAMLNTKYVIFTQNGKSKILDGKLLETKGFRSKTFFAKIDTKNKDKIAFITTDKPKKYIVVETSEKRGGYIDLGNEQVPFKEYGKSAKGSTIVKMKKNETLTKVQYYDRINEEIKNKYEDVTNRTVRNL